MSIGFFETSSNDEITLHGLEKWVVHMYEQLGWITLYHSQNQYEKVGSYLISINKLKSSIESRLRIVTSEDAKLDLNTLLSKIKHLKKIALILFDENKIKKNICDKCANPIKKQEQETTDYDVEVSHPNNIGLISTHVHRGGGTLRKSLHKSNVKKSSKNSLKKSSKKLLKKPSKILSKKPSKILSKKSSKNSLKKLSKDLLKKSSKISSKKSSKKPLEKKIISKVYSKNQDKPLIKKLSKKDSKKIFRK